MVQREWHGEGGSTVHGGSHGGGRLSLGESMVRGKAQYMVEEEAWFRGESMAGEGIIWGKARYGGVSMVGGKYGTGEKDGV